MALLFIDGFDGHITTGQWGQKYTYAADWYGFGTPGRLSRGGYLDVYATSTNIRIEGTGRPGFGDQAPSGDTAICGCALYFSAIGTGGGALGKILLFYSSGTEVVSLQIHAGGTFSLMQGANVLGTTTTPINAATWYYIETKFVIDTSEGTAQLRINNELVLDLSGKNTQGATGGSWDRWQFGLSNISGTVPRMRIDDLYIADGTGAGITTFIGDCEIETLIAQTDATAGGGTYKEWTLSTGGDHGALVDDAQPNTTDYVYSSTQGQRETFTLPSLAMTTGTIHGVQVLLSARKDGTGSRNLESMWRSDGTDYKDAIVALTDSYVYRRQVRELDPGGDVAWTVSRVNALEVGAVISELSSPSLSPSASPSMSASRSESVSPSAS